MYFLKKNLSELRIVIVTGIFALTSLVFLFFLYNEVRAQPVECNLVSGEPCTRCAPVNPADPASGCRTDFTQSSCNLGGYYPDPEFCKTVNYPCGVQEGGLGNCLASQVCSNLGEACTGPGSCCQDQGECDAASGVCKIPATCFASGQTCNGPAGTSGGCCDSRDLCLYNEQRQLTCQDKPLEPEGYFIETFTLTCKPCMPGNTIPQCSPPEFSSRRDCEDTLTFDNPVPVPIDTSTGDTFAIPEPVVPCLESSQSGLGVDWPEFHSMRPYQASPCGDAPKTYFCNQDYFIAEPVRMRWDDSRCDIIGDPDRGGATYICEPPPNSAIADPNSPTGNSPVYIIGGSTGKDYQITLSGVEFPILGNTQDVANSQRSTEAIGHPEKMNEYVNWYLQGVIEKAEYGYVFPRYFSSYAGPTKKLVPLDFLNLQRLKVLHDAGTHAHPFFSFDSNEYQGSLNPETNPTFEGIDPNNPDNVLIDQASAHDQVAVCENGNGLALPCYGSSKADELWRLTNWWEAKGDQNVNARFYNRTISDRWTSAIPPFRWQFREAILYNKAYAEWRGAECIVFEGNLYCGNLGNTLVNACTAASDRICTALTPIIGSLFPNIRQDCSSAYTNICLETTDIRNNIENTCRALNIALRIPDYLAVFTLPLCVTAINEVLDLFPVDFRDTVPRNIASDMYRFIPLGNPSDKNAKHIVSGIGARGPGETEVRVLDYEITDEPVLHYPHTQSTVEVSQLLNQTHTPLKGCGEGDNNCEKIKGTGERYEPASCQFVDIKTNPGDSLTFRDNNVASILVAENVKTAVFQIQCQNEGQLNNFFGSVEEGGCGGHTWSGCETQGCNTALCGLCGDIPRFCRSWPQCRAEIMVEIRSTPKIPFADQIWQNTVVNKTSPFRRIFPKLEEGAPVSCIADIPGTSPVNYGAGPGTNLVKVETAGPNTYTGGSGQLFFPHQGTIYEYFLKGIQTALRPQGMGGYADGQLISGDQCVEPFVCENVAEEYGIPECILQGVMAIETNQGTGGTGACTSSNGRTYNCCTGIGCGPAQVSCSQIGDFAGGDDIDVCDPCGASTLLARAMLLKLCQADRLCNSYDWNVWGNFVMNRYKNLSEDRALEAACYFHGVQTGCHATGCTQYRWGAGVSYGDAIARFCGSGAIPPTVQDFQFCEDCSEEVVRSGLPPLNCSL